MGTPSFFLATIIGPSGSPGLFPSPGSLSFALAQVAEAAQDVGIHKQEVVGDEEVFVFDSLSCQVGSPASRQVE